MACHHADTRVGGEVLVAGTTVVLVVFGGLGAFVVVVSSGSLAVSADAIPAVARTAAAANAMSSRFKVVPSVSGARFRLGCDDGGAGHVVELPRFACPAGPELLSDRPFHGDRPFQV